MSIQSEINRISGEVETQTDLLGQIAAELAGKAAGGDIEIQTDKEAVTPSNVAQTVWPDSGYDALAKVTVKAIPSPYFDTSEVTAGADDVVTGKKIVSASGATINGNNPYEKAATDETVEDQADLIAQIQTALQGKTAGGGATPTLQEKTVTPSETAQTVTPDSGYDGLSKVSVSAISKTYVGSSVTRKSAQTYTPGTSNQIIASGQYLSGTQTIKGDANLLAENIRSGVSIFDVLGTFEGSGGGSAGLPEGVSAMEYGTFVLASDGNTSSIAHGLGVRPDFCVWWLDDAHSVESGGALRGSLTHSTVDAEAFNVGYISVGYRTGGTFNLDTGSVQGMFYMNATRINCFCSSETPLKAGYTYHWIAGVLDTAL